MKDLDWWDNDDKFYVHFEIKAWGKTHEFRGEYDNDVIWQEILNDVVKTVEASYGFAFDLDKADEIGMYYRGKEDE